MKMDKNQLNLRYAGAIKMKKIPLITLICAFFLVNTSASALAKKEKHNTSSFVDLKCYVEVLGGGFMIYRNYDVPVENMKNYKALLKDTSNAARKNNQSKVIYRVIECKEIDKKFRNKAAAELDKLEENMG
jgi:hypothetical protein